MAGLSKNKNKNPKFFGVHTDEGKKKFKILAGNYPSGDYKGKSIPGKVKEFVKTAAKQNVEFIKQAGKQNIKAVKKVVKLIKNKKNK
jgi:hypothetical protein